MIPLYHLLSTLSTFAPLAVCAWLAIPTLRFLLPARMGEHRRHDGLMAAVFILMLNRAWLAGRHVFFGSRLEDFMPGELPYLNAALAWALISIAFLVMILLGYRRQS